MARFIVKTLVVQLMDDPSLLRGEDAVTQAQANITLATTMSTARSKGHGQVFGASTNPALVEQALGGPSGPGGPVPAVQIYDGEKSGA